MSNKPKIYGTCKAGCLWETVHKDDIQSAGFTKLDWYETDTGGVWRCNAKTGVNYRFLANANIKPYFKYTKINNNTNEEVVERFSPAVSDSNTTSLANREFEFIGAGAFNNQTGTDLVIKSFMQFNWAIYNTQKVDADSVKNQIGYNVDNPKTTYNYSVDKTEEDFVTFEVTVADGESITDDKYSIYAYAPGKALLTNPNFIDLGLISTNGDPYSLDDSYVLEALLNEASKEQSKEKSNEIYMGCFDTEVSFIAFIDWQLRKGRLLTSEGESSFTFIVNDNPEYPYEIDVVTIGNNEGSGGSNTSPAKSFIEYAVGDEETEIQLTSNTILYLPIQSREGYLYVDLNGYKCIVHCQIGQGSEQLNLGFTDSSLNIDELLDEDGNGNGILIDNANISALEMLNGYGLGYLDIAIIENQMGIEKIMIECDKNGIFTTSKVFYGEC